MEGFLPYDATQSAVRPQHVIRLSVCLWCSGMFFWNISKIISQLISLRFLLRLTRTWAIYAMGIPQKLRWNRGFVMSSKSLLITPCGVHCSRWSTTVKVSPQSTNSNEQLSRRGRNSASRSWTRASANGVVVLTPWCSRMVEYWAEKIMPCSHNI